jgi:hypothetical protein
VVLYSISRNTPGATGGDRRNFTHDVTATTKEHANSVDAGLTAFGLSRRRYGSQSAASALRSAVV